MQAVMTAIGIANPPYQQQQSIAAEIVANALNLKPAEKRLLKSIYKATGIHTRHSVMADFCRQPGEYEFFPNDNALAFPPTSARMKLYQTHALNLALTAIDHCFVEKPNFNKQTITHLITVSCTGMYAPGIDIEIAQRLDLSTQIKRTTINFMGCYGAFNALKVADAICKADSHAKVLIVSVELCTIHFQKNDSMDNIVSNAIFADGAAAVLIENKQMNQHKKFFTLESFYCDLLPQTSHEMAWHIADSGFDIVLSSYVPQVIEKGIGEFMQRFLQQEKIQFSDIDLYAIHPGGHKILKACEAALNITEIQNHYSYQVLQQYGNMSSATVLFVLKKLWDTLDAAHANKKIFSCAFGPGLTLEAMFLRVSC